MSALGPGFLPSDSRTKVHGTLPDLVSDRDTETPLTRSVCLSNFLIAFLQPSVLRSLRACSGTSRQY